MTSPSWFRASLPVMFGYFPVAVTFGLLAQQQDVGIALTIAFSGLVFAGASQFVGLTLLATKETAFLPVFLTVGLINLRHFVLSLAYLPHVRNWRLVEKLRFFPFLTDETFAVLIGQKTIANQANLAWRVALLNYGTWFVGTLVGFYSGHLIPDPKRMGLDFALSALFVGIIVLFIKKRSHAITFGVTLLLSLIFFRVFDWGRNGVLLAALVGSTIGWLVGRSQEQVA